jgi:hypothetical protein
LKTDGWKADK